MIKCTQTSLIQLQFYRRERQQQLRVFLLTKHTEEVTFENIFEKYFIQNALQKHREDTPTIVLPCVCWQSLSESGKESKSQKEKKQDTNKTNPRNYANNQRADVYKKLSIYLLQRKDNLSTCEKTLKCVKYKSISHIK